MAFGESCLSQLSIKTRIETTCHLLVPVQAPRLSQLSIKTRIETFFHCNCYDKNYQFESAIH